MSEPEKPVWETVTSGDVEDTDRLKVPGGHLYRTTVYQRRYDGDGEPSLEQGGTALCFVPDQAPLQVITPWSPPAPFGPEGIQTCPPAPYYHPPEPPPPPDAASIKKRLLEQMTSPETEVYVDVFLEVLKTPKAQRIMAAIREALASAKGCPVCLGSGEHLGEPCPACGGKKP